MMKKMQSHGIRGSSRWNKRIKPVSALPDEILIHILSGFDDVARAAAATCLLSKRWQLLWTKIPSLDFSEHSWNFRKKGNFVSWVNRVIACRSHRSYDALERFSVNFTYRARFALDVRDWIRFALKNDVKDLTLDLWSGRDRLHYTPPEELYSHSSFTRMSLWSCVLAPRGKIEWPRLTCLSVCCVELTQRVVENLLSGCRVLRDLSLTSCWGFDSIDSESLHTLTVSYANGKYYCKEDSLGISAPGLSSLDVSFSPVNKKLLLTNVGPTSLDSVKIDYTSLDNSEALMNSTMELLEKTRHAKRLVLKGYFLQVVSKMATHSWQLPQSTWQQLTIETWRHEKMIPGILCLLGSSPTLQTLLIECANRYKKKSTMTWGPAATNDLDCDLLNLKNVRLLYYAHPEFDGEPMLEIARILITWATMLKEMVIKIKELTSTSSTNFNKMIQALLDYAKSSEKRVVRYSSVNGRCFIISG